MPGPEPEGGTSRDGRTFAEPPGGGGMRRPLAVRLALAVAVVILHKQSAAEGEARHAVRVCSCKVHVVMHGAARCTARLCAHRIGPVDRVQ